MPVLVIAVVAFIIFNIMMVLFVSAVVSEQRQRQREDELRTSTAKGSAGKKIA